VRSWVSSSIQPWHQSFGPRVSYVRLGAMEHLNCTRMHERLKSSSQNILTLKDMLTYINVMDHEILRLIWQLQMDK